MVFEGDFAGGAGAVEGIEYKVAGTGTGQDAGFDEAGREGGEMGFGVARGGDRPYVALVAGRHAVEFVADEVAFRVEVARMSGESTPGEAVLGLDGIAVILHVADLGFGFVAAHGFVFFAAPAHFAVFGFNARQDTRPALVSCLRHAVWFDAFGSEALGVFWGTFHARVFAAIVGG